MKFKKIIPQLVTAIKEAGFDTHPKELQSLSIPKIKSGADLFCLAPEKEGKSTTIVMGVIQQLKEAFEEAPRAIIITPTKEKAFELEEQFNTLGKYTNLRTFVAFDQGILQYQKDEIYDGLDVLICTPKRLMELVNINGVPMTKIKMLIVDNAETVISNTHHAIIYRIADGLKNPQILFFASRWHKSFETVEERIMKNPLVFEIEASNEL
ncbi:DEAD/DEAH box helicase [Carboxylicivirga sediminis]|uniref:DEAD/DEAH box helicase n=1 Tax=Carboxylicivirga sediminis TaxID=2006564 RepID=A0A941IYM2_9BACT|nr:DEAD/DEAH box helicase [Carboxylicivirga sediminis]MBR8538036.1 DEAD/DEAH box helicase [Carboxylicivirga sediminis]